MGTLRRASPRTARESAPAAVALCDVRHDRLADLPTTKYSTRTERTCIVAGALANKPYNGGESWVRLSWILGLRRLGFAVHVIEQGRPDGLEYLDASRGGSGSTGLFRW